MPRSRRYLLLCGSTLLNVADPHVEFFQSQLQPWVHYVPVAQDFSDLNARLQWLGDNQVEAQKIGEAGRDWALKHLQPHSLVRCSAHESPHLFLLLMLVFLLQLDFTLAAIKGAAALQKSAPLVQSSQLLHLGIKTVAVSSHADIDAAL